MLSFPFLFSQSLDLQKKFRKSKTLLQPERDGRSTPTQSHLGRPGRDSGSSNCPHDGSRWLAHLRFPLCQSPFFSRARGKPHFFGVSMFGSRRYLYIRSQGKVTSLEGKSTPFSVPKPRGEAGGTRRQSGASDAMEERICDEGRGRVDAAAADGVPGLDDSPWRPRAAAPVDDPPPQRLFLNMHTKQDQVEVGSKN